MATSSPNTTFANTTHSTVIPVAEPTTTATTQRANLSPEQQTALANQQSAIAARQSQTSFIGDFLKKSFNYLGATLNTSKTPLSEEQKQQLQQDYAKTKAEFLNELEQNPVLKEKVGNLVVQAEIITKIKEDTQAIIQQQAAEKARQEANKKADEKRQEEAAKAAKEQVQQKQIADKTTEDKQKIQQQVDRQQIQKQQIVQQQIQQQQVKEDYVEKIVLNTVSSKPAEPVGQLALAPANNVLDNPQLDQTRLVAQQNAVSRNNAKRAPDELGHSTNIVSLATASTTPSPNASATS
jgi:hypothetical protein